MNKDIKTIDLSKLVYNEKENCYEMLSILTGKGVNRYGKK